jgi:hypothetical protein
LLGGGRPYGASCCRRRLSVPSGAEMTQMGQRQRSWFRVLLHARRRRGVCGAATSVRSRPYVGSEGLIGLRRDHCALKLPRRPSMPPIPVACLLTYMYLPRKNAQHFPTLSTVAGCKRGNDRMAQRQSTSALMCIDGHPVVVLLAAHSKQ